MYLMYVDESGDCGLVKSPTRYFILTGIVLHELRWHEYKDRLVDYRRRMRTAFGLKLREEIHASHMINKSGSLLRIRRNDRLMILLSLINELAAMRDLTVINVVVDKTSKQAAYDVFGMAWKALIQRFENTMSHRNFNGPTNADERGTLFPDHTDDKKLTRLLRQLRVFNPIPNQRNFGAGFRNLGLTRVVEDPNYRDSEHSYFIQACDVVAFMLHQQLAPNSYMRTKNGDHIFRRLDPVLAKVCAPADPQGIVRL
jgi:hypothetical protein